jgi:hypothetical protein
MLPTTTSQNGRENRMRRKSLTSAWVLIALGTYFLLSKRGWMPNLGPLISEWWPAILIIIGISMIVRRSSDE